MDHLIHLSIVECNIVDPEIINVSIQTEYLGGICAYVCVIIVGTGGVVNIGGCAVLCSIDVDGASWDWQLFEHDADVEPLIEIGLEGTVVDFDGRTAGRHDRNPIDATSPGSIQRNDVLVPRIGRYRHDPSGR
jgi:hypothetical protein